MYLSSKGRLSEHIDFIIIDLICMELSFVISYFIRHGNFDLLSNKSYRAVLIILIVANILTCYLFNTMKEVLKRSKQLEFYATLKQVLLTTIILIIYLFLTKTSEDISRNVIIVFPILYFIISYLTRLLYKLVYKRIIKNKTKRELVLITIRDKAKSIISNINNSVNDINIKGIILLDDDNVKEVDGVSVIANKDNMFKYLQTEYVDEVFLSAGDFDVSELIKKLSIMGIVLHIEFANADLLSGSNNSLIVDNIADTTVLTSTINIISPIQIVVKRIIDIIFGIIGTVLTGVFAITIGLIIKLKSKGPMFFVQYRVGKNGKVFKMIKFRSMVLSADEQKETLKLENDNKDQMMFKMENDPRVIQGIGEFIRKTSIDEFPQFINVLKGDMSVVGTRPPTLDEWNKYDLHHRARLAIKPGITGLWQVSGRSNIKDFEDVVRLDTEYIRNFSLWNDFSIIYKTIKVVLTREGAR